MPKHHIKEISANAHKTRESL